VYSVGSNREDDVGEWEQYSDLQLSRRGNPLDIGIVARPWPRFGPLGPDEGDGRGRAGR
jgi:hypothetical protein